MMNFLIQKPDWQITNLVFNSLGICLFPAQNLQTFASETQLIISLSCIVARKFARNYSQISKFYERRFSLYFNGLHKLFIPHRSENRT